MFEFRAMFCILFIRMEIRFQVQYTILYICSNAKKKKNGDKSIIPLQYVTNEFLLHSFWLRQT